MNPYLEALQPKLSQKDFKKLSAIDNPTVHEFIAKESDLCHPEKIFICSDSVEDIAFVRKQAIASGEEKATLTLEGHTVHFDGEKDQGRDRKNTKYLVPKGVTFSKALNQMDRQEGLSEVRGLMRDIMVDKTMIVRFISLGPKDSDFTILGLQCTDSWYVAHTEDLLYRPGYQQFVKAGPKSDFLRVIHSAGELDSDMTSVNYDQKRIYIDYMDNTIYSVNTQYAGNSVGFKKLAFRLAIRKASSEGWLAEHMLLMGVFGPNNRKTYFAGAFPSACGKTSTAMLPGETILGDDIAYIRDVDSTARAVNVESGIFGIIQDVNPEDDALIWKVLTSPGEIVFSNILVKDGKPYWLGMGQELPKEGLNYTGTWYEGKKDEEDNEIPAANKNARYAVALKNLDNVDPELDNPLGVELGGIMYGGRDAKAYVPVQQSFSWEHGIIAYGASLETETTFATIGKEGVPEINMMSIQDFISIPMGRNVKNNLDFGCKLKKQPIVFGVNYFLKDLNNGKYLNNPNDKHVWIKWMELRVHKEVEALKTPTGYIPIYEDLRKLFKQVLNKNYAKDDYIKQFTIRVPENLAKIERVQRFYQENVTDTPLEMFGILYMQRERLLKASQNYGDYISPECFEKEQEVN
ncbi:MAG: phosphoenolpyruvate carboxykinase (GTP) [Candidatus Bathyarchaeota archaeon]|nr:phosphoenolpyruvate carboxykinase (GTP) [Candidatus Bathyarchaeota archaeon]MDD4325138.1 phosphoenolpyruvate carboxykinase (GTP) [Candidatus Bathyarchaeota archaeon]MDI9578238.1 phosphoenolpyruvate carboxykinase (GTP) [Thermoproteota archaeon]MDT8782079.1 phosphoenolpyruvate carboxykinase (GTP) [Candidatus Bathyarchaeota archaeon]NLD65970.1 phosphoenolpyruvate carboxykinase (GTP) [Thermoproteota archaeon]